MHKIAVLSDIHGNLSALEAVLADAKGEKATDYWILGDLVMLGPGSSDLLNQLRKLPNATFIKGNWDEVLLDVATYDFSNPTNVYGARLAKYHYEQLSEEELNFLESLPEFIVKEVAGFKFLLCHHLPNKNYGGDLHPTAQQEKFDSLFTDHQVDVAIYGHMHRKLMRYSSNGQLIINPGSVYPPTLSDNERGYLGLKPQYVLIEVDQSGIGNIHFKQVDYDIEKEMTFAQQKRLPYLDFYRAGLTEGRSFTHNKEVLKKVNDTHGYQEEVEAYFNRN